MPERSSDFAHLTKNYGKVPSQQNKALQEVTRQHIEAFNYFIKDGLLETVKNIRPCQWQLKNGDHLSFTMVHAYINKPTVDAENYRAMDSRVFPAECRERGSTYEGLLTVKMEWSLNGVVQDREDCVLGAIPIMVKSVACNLDGLTPAELIRHGEEAEEMGGYFIANGNEKLMRMLVTTRKHYPIAMMRPSWSKWGQYFTDRGIYMRSVASDQTRSLCILHYLHIGSATLSVGYNKERFFIPVIMILKCLFDCTDQFIYTEATLGHEDNQFYKGCVANMLRQLQKEDLPTQNKIMKFVGSKFRLKLQCPEWYTDKQVAEFLLKHCVLIHLDSNEDKFNLLIYMMQKLFIFAEDACAKEEADNPMLQEVLMGGHVYQIALKEKMESFLQGVRMNLQNAERRKGSRFVLNSQDIKIAIRNAPRVHKHLHALIATGNISTRTGLGLEQTTALTIVADKLNFIRYISHFRSIHRGSFFTEMRTTAVRKLLPEAWGFFCPVHTPDGTPCGLLNHLSAACQIVNTKADIKTLDEVLTELGMIPHKVHPACPLSQTYTVMVEGRVAGRVLEREAKAFCDQLRALKVTGLKQVPKMLEICFVPKTALAGPYPGIYLFSSMSRMVRPVMNLAHKEIEYIGTFEQVFLDICVNASEAHPQLTTHQELKEDSMLSVVASFTPFSDFNQSPRNMYQCQMGKQTMGTPLHALGHRSDNKLFRLQTPQSPLVRPDVYSQYELDNYPLGTNAIVAVISYTGYDMEDAMILNKSSYERGFGHGMIYKSEFVDLTEIAGTKKTMLAFGANETDEAYINGHVGLDGLPPIGGKVTKESPFCVYYNVENGEKKVIKYKNQEEAVVEQVKLCGSPKGNEELQRICIVFRIQRNPIIGDKFASRHGQKGICSQKWPVEDMPFTESGMVPDILFNPHGFPSRMTIGMMIESMAGKSAAIHGIVHDATPFTFSEDHSAIDYFGNMLTAAGYNHHGTERMYSGIDGREMEADIFMGVVYYQRLRHMVADKFQVRSEGPVDRVTHQPVKGRKKMGGVRFGEMERDAIISHGAAFILDDRLLKCSDKSEAYICNDCGSMLSTVISQSKSVLHTSSTQARTWICHTCSKKTNRNALHLITVPHVFRYLVAELAAMNIKVKMTLKSLDM